MAPQKTACVYCASSSKADKVYIDAAYTLGKLLAENEIRCVFGAGKTGLMGALARGVMDNRGEIIGVIPEFMIAEGWGNEDLTQLKITPTIHSRKDTMAQLSDATIAMPGGCGTLEELMEIITWKQLGLFSGAVIILNINNYYTPLIEMLERAVEERFMREEHRAIWQVVTTPQEAIDALNENAEWIKDARKIAAI
ncbi:MAG: TIGR00730 family Rossman fold protein [Muribaculaceae bacterium]|nr:TIGR00730 family Rossman fold protein [Muribaculaceae bacterium]